jgi:hypothetical protein
MQEIVNAVVSFLIFLLLFVFLIMMGRYNKLFLVHNYYVKGFSGFDGLV